MSLASLPLATKFYSLRRADATDMHQFLAAYGITSRVGEDVFDRHSLTEVISENVTRRLQA